jgi:hypothetical protein
MKRWITAACLLVLILDERSAGQQTPQGQFMLYGAGVQSCGTWTQNRRSQSNLQYLMSQWVMGWVSARGYYGTPMRKADADALDGWIDNYCREHPLEQLKGAAEALVRELER